MLFCHRGSRSLSRWGRIIESEPTLGLWDMYAADMVTTVTAEQSDAPLWSQNLPPQSL